MEQRGVSRRGHAPGCPGFSAKTLGKCPPSEHLEDADRPKAALRRATRLEAENRLLSVESRPTLIAESAAMQPVLNLIARIGPSDANVLITGEHGTGKEVVARTLHAMSGRSNRS